MYLHRVGAALAESELPHLQLKGDVMRVLSGEVGDRRGLAGAVRSVAIVAGLKILRGIADPRELFTPRDQRWICTRQGQEGTRDACVIGDHIRRFLGRQGLGDRRHHGIGPHARGEVLHLLVEIIG